MIKLFAVLKIVLFDIKEGKSLLTIYSPETHLYSVQISYCFALVFSIFQNIKNLISQFFLALNVQESDAI